MQAVDDTAKRRCRPVLRWLGRVATVALLVAAGFVWGHWVTPPRDECNAFDGETWRRAKRAGSLATTYRRLQPQVDALTGCPAILVGRDRDGIRELLGAPDQPVSKSTLGAGTWAYSVGAPEGQSDAPPMGIVFGSDGRVTRVERPE